MHFSGQSGVDQATPLMRQFEEGTEGDFSLIGGGIDGILLSSLSRYAMSVSAGRSGYDSLGSLGGLFSGAILFMVYIL